MNIFNHLKFIIIFFFLLISNRFYKLSRSTAISIVVFLFLSVSYSSLYAQEENSSKQWSFLVEPYVMFPYMDGTTGINVENSAGIGDNLILPVDANPGDIFSKLQMGAMLFLEAKTDMWAITSDLVYMNLNQQATPGERINSGDITAKQFIWEVAGLYRILSYCEIGLGGRLNYLDISANATVNKIPTGTEVVTGEQNQTWFDPLIITRLTTDIQDKWLFQFRADVGGFGIGSDLTWQLQGYVGYRFSKLFQLSAGYRLLSTDYNHGESPKQFVFNVNEYGPAVKFGFNF